MKKVDMRLAMLVSWVTYALGIATGTVIAIGASRLL